MIKGYKITNNGIGKNNIKYEVGNTYTTSDMNIHYCKNIDNVFKYYDYDKKIKIYEIEAYESIHDLYQSVTTKLKVVREVLSSEYNLLFKRYKFDNHNNMIKHIFRNGNTESWQYDNHNNMIEHVFWNIITTIIREDLENDR